MSPSSLKHRAAGALRAILGRLELSGRAAGDRVLDDRQTMARTFTYLFGVGATLLLATMALPHSPDRDTLGLVLTGVAAYVAAGGFLAVYDRLPPWLFEVSPVLGTALVSLAVYFGGSDSPSAYAMYYIWVALAACYFLRPGIAAVQLALASAAYGAVLLILGNDVTLPGLKWAMTTGTLAVVGGLMIVLRAQLQSLVAQLGAAARTDSLTGLANRRDLEDRFAPELERSTRTGRPLSILVLDLDWFKEFNDRFGHTAGDQALVRLANALRRATRTSDVVARLGGEEFAVLAPETDEPEGFLLAERLRSEVKAAFARETEKMTISCGVATFPVHGITSGELLHSADRALYEA
jgi:diguanylate cyclase (GGDEF)-like protein